MQTFCARTHTPLDCFAAAQIFKSLPRVWKESIPFYFKALVTHSLTGVKDGLKGADFAFYGDRAVYHTPRDSIAQLGTEEAKKSVWTMMDSVRGTGLSLLNDDRPSDADELAVYFDS